MGVSTSNNEQPLSPPSFRPTNQFKGDAQNITLHFATETVVLRQWMVHKGRDGI